MSGRGVRSGIGPTNTESTRRTPIVMHSLLWREQLQSCLKSRNKGFHRQDVKPLDETQDKYTFWSEADFSKVAFTGAQSAAATWTLSAAIYLLSQRSLSENSS